MSSETRKKSSARTIRAPRGTELTCKAWPQEAAYRMIQHNLDPEVAERAGGARRLWRHGEGRPELRGFKSHSRGIEGARLRTCGIYFR